MTKTMMGLLLCAAVLPAMASEQEVARKACERVFALDKQQGGMIGAAIDPAKDCQMNVRSAQFWQCTEAQMRNGQQFVFAAEQCSKADKSRQ